ncbi:glycosyltransferase [Clostridium oryzae]|uniref:N, N'-diacetylbacillosaminyl-diphospho-undecaprenol alpha-1,3-N-acetylgalactosaminyltransferase n=1 Tax=Clostridium oryzae TaxID=1450648 RepID=A0A1V4I5E8_9CLOT|nr:glycosyltransferase [Clostridium oryzae]OPJ54845.1 N,N'-diacetylbacillosaminyl-diphospho-undecaprenol alpha-1,3-N-acetylgalactosaminyltransferase [Clostridium oryzae]
MKILYLIHVFYPESFYGTEKFLFNISSYMKREGNEVQIITYSNYEDNFYNEAFENLIYKKFQYEGLDIIAFRHKNPIPPLEYDFNNLEIRDFAEKIIGDFKPDIVHICHPIRTSEFASVAKDRNIPYIITLTDFSMMCPRGNLLTSTLKLCTGRTNNDRCNQECYAVSKYTEKRYKCAETILNQASYVFSPSNFLAKMFEEHFNGLKVYVNNHGINYKRIVENKKVYKDKDRIIFGYAGGTLYIKGLTVLLKAFSKIKDPKSSLKLYGFQFDDISSILVDKYKLHNVEFCGVFGEEDVGKVLSEIDVLVVPSLCYENYPLTLHEALACNIPVIASNVGGMAEKIKNCFNGFVYDIGNADQLSTIIQFIIDNPVILNSLKNNIKNEKLNSIEHECNTYLGTYKKILPNNIVSDSENTNKNDFESEWKAFTKQLLIDDKLDNEYMEKMKTRVLFLKGRFGNKKIRYYIWGASNSGRVTKKIFSEFLPNFELSGFIDKYKSGTYENYKIYNLNKLDNNIKYYYVIATTIGKNEAYNTLREIGMELLDNIILGYGL